MEIKNPLVFSLVSTPESRLQVPVYPRAPRLRGSLTLGDFALARRCVPPVYRSRQNRVLEPPRAEWLVFRLGAASWEMGLSVHRAPRGLRTRTEAIVRAS